MHWNTKTMIGSCASCLIEWRMQNFSILEDGTKRKKGEFFFFLREEQNMIRIVTESWDSEKVA